MKMASLTCVMDAKGATPDGLVRVPPASPARQDFPVAIRDESDEEVGCAMARSDIGLSPGAFLVSTGYAERLGLESGFDYFIEPIIPAPPTLQSANIRYVGRKPLAENPADAISIVKSLQKGMEMNVVEPGRALHGGTDFHLEYSPEVHPRENGPPWILDPRTRITIEDHKGPLDVIIAIDGPTSMNKKDIPDGERKEPRPRVEVLSTAVARLCRELARNKHEAKVAFFLFQERARPVLFSENNQSGPWLSCHLKPPDQLIPVVREVLSSRISSTINSSRNLGGCLKELFEFVRAQNTGPASPSAMIVLFSDGQYTEGPNPVSVMREHCQNGLDKILHVVCMGGEVEERLLKKCARLGHGTYQRAPTVESFISTVRSLSRFKVSCDDPD